MFAMQHTSARQGTRSLDVPTKAPRQWAFICPSKGPFMCPSMHTLSLTASGAPKVCSLPQMGQIANRQSLVFSERGRLSQAIPQVHVERILHQQRQSLDSNRSATNAGSTRTKFCGSRRRYDCQRTLVIRIAAITLASDSAITFAISPI